MARLGIYEKTTFSDIACNRGNARAGLPPLLVGAVIDLDRLYWKADKHGYDYPGHDCGCPDGEHEKSAYPSIEAELTRIMAVADRLVAEDETTVQV